MDKVSKSTYMMNTDLLLDRYNDYMELYKNFGDTHYLWRADEALNALRVKQIMDRELPIQS